jgi:asparagine synthase (glutamine-hydrolysing)
MCGILWSIVQAELEKNFSRLQHRGPENSNYVIHNGHFLGTHRLAIINPTEEGNQPLHHNCMTLICNGQIYNYKELANGAHQRTDVDVILHLFDQGLTLQEVAHKLDGDFAFVVLKDGIIHAARDPIGVRPLFYGTDETGAVICIASEVKAIKDLPLVKSCHVFPPGHTYDSATKEFKPYTDIYVDANDSITRDDAMDIIREGLVRAVEKRIDNSDRPIAFLCSGGIDSSIIMALAYDILKQRGKDKLMHVFSISFDDNGRSRSDDAFYAKMLMQQYAVTYTPITFNWNDVINNVEAIAKHIESYDPNTIRASVPMYMLAKYIKENTDFKVILSGEGADELFMGYNIFMRATDGTTANQESKRLIRNIHMFDGLRADRCFNAHGLELRVPFLDINFMRSVFAIPGQYKMYVNGREKSLLRDSFAHITQLSRSRVLDRVKERFSDGCGFGYVPKLLSHWSDPDENNLENKEASEKAVYGKWFDAEYPSMRHLIITRENPTWAKKVQGTPLIST